MSFAVGSAGSSPQRTYLNHLAGKARGVKSTEGRVEEDAADAVELRTADS